MTPPAAGQGPARARVPLGRADPPDPRHRRAVQGGQRAADQEGAGAPRQDDRQSLLRGLHPHPHLVRVRREAALGRHGERGRSGVSSVSKGETLVDTARNLEAMRIDMVVIRHRASGAAEFLGEADPLQRDQRRRRQARASDAGAARPAHAARPVRADRGAQGGHLRRRAAQPGGPEQHLGAAPSSAPRWRCAARRSLLPRDIESLGVDGHSAHRGGDRSGPTRSTSCGCSSSG